MSRIGPLDGVSVVAFDAIGPVPLACSMLEEMGASVITIKRPRDGAALPAGLDGTSAPNGRHSVGIDLKRSEGVATAKRILAGADVLVEGFRPGVLERLGLGPDVVCELNPGLVFARVTGWGQAGDYALMAGHDINYIGLNGVLAAIGTRKRPIPPLNLVADYGGGTMFALTGILAALVERGVTGEGQIVDIAMVDGSARLLGPIRHLANAGVWNDTRQANLLDGGAPFYRTYATSDGGFMAVGALEPAFYSQFVEGLGFVESELPNRFDPEKWEDLADRFALVFARRTRAHWQEVFEDTDACVTPVLGMHEVMEHRHNAQRRALVGGIGEERPAAAPRFDSARSGTTGADALTAPDSDAASDTSVLAEWGFSDAEVDRLVAEGIIARR